MKYGLLNIIIAFILLSMTACETVVNIHISETDKQIVVNGLFDQTAPLELSITESISPYNENIDIQDLTQSEVALYENAIFIEYMTYHRAPGAESGNYYSTLIPHPGNNYSIEITDPVYGKVKALSGIPTEVIISKSWANWTPWGEDTLNVIRFNFEFELDDPPEENYYYLTIGCPLLKPDTTGGAYVIFDYQYAQIYSADIANPQLYLKNGWLFTDVNFNGTKYLISGTATMYVNPCCDYDPDVIINKKELYVFLENLSQEAHNFHSSYAQRLSIQNDFYAEPSSIYSNIDNGNGIFGGSSLTEIQIPIKY